MLIYVRLDSLAKGLADSVHGVLRRNCGWGDRIRWRVLSTVDSFVKARTVRKGSCTQSGGTSWSETTWPLMSGRGAAESGRAVVAARRRTMKCRSQPGAAGGCVVRRGWSVIGGGGYPGGAVWRGSNFFRTLRIFFFPIPGRTGIRRGSGKFPAFLSCGRSFSHFQIPIEDRFQRREGVLSRREPGGGADSQKWEEMSRNGAVFGVLRAFGAENGRPGPSGTRPGLSGTRPGLSGTRPGVSGRRPGVSGTRPGLVGSRPGPSGSSPGLSGTRPGLFGTRPGSFGKRPGSFGRSPGKTGRRGVGAKFLTRGAA